MKYGHKDLSLPTPNFWLMCLSQRTPFIIQRCACTDRQTDNTKSSYKKVQIVLNFILNLKTLLVSFLVFTIVIYKFEIICTSSKIYEDILMKKFWMFNQKICLYVNSHFKGPFTLLIYPCVCCIAFLAIYEIMQAPQNKLECKITAQCVFRSQLKHTNCEYPRTKWTCK